LRSPLQLAASNWADLKVFRLPISDSLRKFDELEFVTKLPQVTDVRVVDLRRFTAEGTDEYSQRIR
jgi:hypothetical protein